MASLIKKIGLNPLIKIPKSIINKLNNMENLDLNTKYVLATLYYFDSINNLSIGKKKGDRRIMHFW